MLCNTMQCYKMLTVNYSNVAISNKYDLEHFHFTFLNDSLMYIKCSKICQERLTIHTNRLA